ncbi:sulfotransferase [Roseomonas eburnea]|uniref:Sulfotransferase n=1 Tax=Neoroseomonas eburnea TaxID=1346889 RepID=A0A9X9XJB5_9PROT|nr:sulfotransferase [Neoroseomonas eburnea]MBR0683801.1 sulfotransferase [Neoroseomonas eburnea]
MTLIDRKALRFPDFLCIGAQKAGTTWLDANLRRHPRIWMPWIKELQYFNHVHIPAHRAWTGRHRWSHGEKAARRLMRRAGDAAFDMAALHRITSIATEPVSDEWYGRIFAHAGEDQICGEVTPEYSLLPPEGIEHVRRLNPRMKIIFLMRDPVERCWSQIRMLASRDAALDVRRLAVQDEMVARSDYRSILTRWEGVFGCAQIFTADFVEVAEAPARLIERICEFLGLPVHPAAVRRAGDVVFAGQELAIPADVRDLLHARLDGVYRTMCDWRHEAADSVCPRPCGISEGVGG